MNTFTRTQRPTTFIPAGMLALAAIALAAPADASRIPADPTTFAGTPIAVSQLVNGSHAANVWAALEDLRAER
jgi:hypothetical protein